MINLEKLFDLVCHMNEHPGEPYEIKEGVKLDYKRQGRVLKKGIQAFIHGSTGSPIWDSNGERKVVQAFSGSSDLPELTKDVFTVTNAVPEYDTLWQTAFRGIRLRKGQLSWEISNVTSGVLFELTPEGGKAKFYGFSGTTTPVGIAKYSAGIGVTWEMIEGRKLYAFIEQMEFVRSALYTLWANTHYGLLATAAATNAVAWQGAAVDPILDRDIATLNEGYETIGLAVKDSGYGDVANAVMLCYANPNLKSRLNQAFRATSPDIISGRPVGAASSAAGQIVEFNIVPRYSYNSSIPANKALLVLPGNKIQNSVYLRELSLAERDLETLSELRTYWTAFGAVVGDANQTAELAFA